MSGKGTSRKSSRNLKRKLENIEEALPEVTNQLEAESSEPEAIHQAFPLTDLPNEVLENIFSHVSFDDLFMLESVSRRIHTLIKDRVWPTKHILNHDSIIQHTDFPKLPLFKEGVSQQNERYSGGQRHNLTIKSIEAMISRTELHHLDLSIYSRGISYKIYPLLYQTPQLRTLNLSYIRFPKLNASGFLDMIAGACPLLEELSIEYCFQDSALTDGLISIFTQCSNLKHLNLVGNYFFHGSCFALLPTGLRYLNLARCFNSKHSTMKAMNAVAKRAPNLETLILEGDCGIPENLFDNLTKLKTLEISFWAPGYHSSLAAMNFSNLKDLERLSLRGNMYVLGVALRSLEACPKLEVLDLGCNSFLKSAHLEILKNCRSFKYCNFSGWEEVKNIVDFVKSTQIQYLAINQCRNFPFKAVESLVFECDSLTHLEAIYDSEDCHQSISHALSRKRTSPRPNKLHLAFRKFRRNLPSCDWCKVYPCNVSISEASPFSHLIYVRN